MLLGWCMPGFSACPERPDRQVIVTSPCWCEACMGRVRDLPRLVLASPHRNRGRRLRCPAPAEHWVVWHAMLGPCLIRGAASTGACEASVPEFPNKARLRTAPSRADPVKHTMIACPACSCLPDHR